MKPKAPNIDQKIEAQVLGQRDVSDSAFAALQSWFSRPLKAIAMAKRINLTFHHLESDTNHVTALTLYGQWLCANLRQIGFIGHGIGKGRNWLSKLKFGAEL